MDDILLFLIRLVLAISVFLTVVVMPLSLFVHRKRRYCSSCGRELEKVMYPLTYNEYTGKPEKQQYWLMCPVCQASQPIPPRGG